jgi:hypothetical protein
VHVVGTKYIDYFTDGTKTYSFLGNPDIDSNLNKPNAPIPTHGNLQLGLHQRHGRLRHSQRRS